MWGAARVAIPESVGWRAAEGWAKTAGTGAAIGAASGASEAREGESGVRDPPGEVEVVAVAVRVSDGAGRDRCGEHARRSAISDRALFRAVEPHPSRGGGERAACVARGDPRFVGEPGAADQSAVVSQRAIHCRPLARASAHDAAGRAPRFDLRVRQREEARGTGRSDRSALVRAPLPRLSRVPLESSVRVRPKARTPVRPRRSAARATLVATEQRPLAPRAHLGSRVAALSGASLQITEDPEEAASSRPSTSTGWRWIWMRSM